jgi:acetyltransferase-like isoleucine patch superfamily enzyme
MDNEKTNLFQRVARRIVLLPGPFSFSRKIYLQLLGAKIGAGTRIPRCDVPWPHQIQIGNRCVLEPDIYFKFDGYWHPGPSIIIGNNVFIGRGVEFNVQGRIEIGDDAGIGSGCVLADHNHNTAIEGHKMRDQSMQIAPIIIGKDVIVGVNSVILRGVHIGDGAVVGAGAVVVESVPAGEIWVGNPAKKLRDRRQEQPRMDTNERV